jgi:membrane protease subunit HflC
MNRVTLIIGALATVFVVVIALSSVYTLNPMQQVLVLQFAAPKEIVTDPGLHVIVPGMQSVEYIDKRLLYLEAPPEEVITVDKKRLVVDAFARWRIVDPLRFYQTLTNDAGAEVRLTPILSSDLRRVLGSQTFSTMLSGARAELMHDIRDNMNQESRKFGVEIVDVRIRHADLPQQNSNAIYQRMQQERKREANEFRAEGEEIAQRIKSRADREVTVLVAEAGRESQILRGEGEAERTKILADAYGQDPDFFAFFRSLQAYQDALSGDNTSLVLSPNSEFFRYFGQTGAQAAQQAPRSGGRKKH